jgi:glycine oxidase
VLRRGKPRLYIDGLLPLQCGAMKTWDAIIVGGGIIGLSAALDLRRKGAEVAVLERGQPGREASHAAAGMLAFCDPDTHPLLQDFCFASARLYPEYVKAVEADSGMDADFRRDGTIAFLTVDEAERCTGQELTPGQVRDMEPLIQAPKMRAFHLPEQSVDNRALVSGLLAACERRGVELQANTEVTKIDVEAGRTRGISTATSTLLASAVVNCAGAWAARVEPQILPTRPRKGQMLAVSGTDPRRPLLRHVIRTPEIYLVPRSDGRIVIGATVEDAGYDKHVNPAAIRKLHDAGAGVLPELAHVGVREAWAGLRPGSPDDLPIIGATAVPGYFAATGHFRNGILLAPITAKVVAEMVRGEAPSFDLVAFSPRRFEH